MQFRKRNLLALALIGSTLAGCGNSVDDDTPPMMVQPRQEDQFGANFGAAFRADANSEPRTPADGDIVPVSLTAEPVTIN